MNPVILVCSCLLMVQSLLPRTAGSRVALNVDEYRSRAGQAAMLEDLTLMVRDLERSYANKIRNELIRNELYALETSAEATPRGRAITKKNYSSFVPSCSCESITETVLLGEDYYPMGLQTQRCTGNCVPPYQCKAVHYWVAVLKKMKGPQSGAGAHPTTAAAVWEWEPRRVNVTTSCVCAAN
ncbi:hypothetical protein NE865_06757 [Phthorimaea operculella]|nr:hypothetical protein NE865_06757 [Phthorimaea operculella]